MTDLPTQLLPTTIRRLESDITLWFHEAERGVTAEMVQHPDYWANVARKMKPHDRIDVVAKDGTFDLDLRVVAVDQALGLWAQVRMLRALVSDAVVADTDGRDSDGYRIDWSGPHKFRIIDRAGHVVAKLLPSRADAQEKLAEIKAAKAAAA